MKLTMFPGETVASDDNGRYYMKQNGSGWCEVSIDAAYQHIFVQPKHEEPHHHSKGSTEPETLTLNIGDAAQSLGVSRDFFDDHIRAELKLIHVGRLVLVPRSELERWVEENARFPGT